MLLNLKIFIQLNLIILIIDSSYTKINNQVKYKLISNNNNLTGNKNASNLIKFITVSNKLQCLAECTKLCLCLIAIYKSSIKSCYLFENITYFELTSDSIIYQYISQQKCSADPFLKDLTYYWKFNNDYNEEISGTKLQPGLSTSFVNDRFNNYQSALFLNNGYTTAPSLVYFYKDFSVSVWVYLIAYSSWSVLLDFSSGPGTNNVYIALSGDTFYPTFTVYDSQLSPYRLSFIYANSKLTLNKWCHLAVTLNNTLATIYLDGNLVGQGSCYSIKPSIRSINKIGTDSWNSPSANAYLDDLKIYNRSMTQSEIRILTLL